MGHQRLAARQCRLKSADFIWQSFFPQGQQMSAVFFSWSDLLSLLSGNWLLPPSVSVTVPGVSGISDDSRDLLRGNLFVAIVGETADGHRFLPQAVAAGAAAVCVETAPEPEIRQLLHENACPCLQVADSLAAFQTLAQASARKFPQLQILAITGSSGKTSTKEMCATLLEQRWPGQILKTLGNTNNHFGLPRNLLRLNSNHRLAVLEMGSNHPGEIARLATLAPPQVGLVCNIGAAHLEFFHHHQGVAKEKGDLLALTAKDGIAIFPEEAPGREILQEKAGRRKSLTFGGSANADVRCEYLGVDTAGLTSLRLSWKDNREKYEFQWKIGGAHQALNAAAAAAAATAFGLTAPEIIAGLQNCTLPEQRMQIVPQDEEVFWANDAYNSNPDSAAAALAWFAEVSRQAKQRILILGEMRELGESAPQAHAHLLHQAQKTFPEAEIITVGNLMAEAAKNAQVAHFPDVDALLTTLPKKFPPHTWILLKASNGVKLYTLTEKK